MASRSLIPQKILVIQPAFIGDAILALSIVQVLAEKFPNAQIDLLLRAGNENIAQNHPNINTLLIWQKKKNKLRNLFNLLKIIRQTKYDWVINLHRFFTSGLLTALSGAKYKVGFDKNPLSFLFDERYPHAINSSSTAHEVERNFQLIAKYVAMPNCLRPIVYPTKEDIAQVQCYICQEYYVIAPSSVWFTKQAPASVWEAILRMLPNDTPVYLIGAPSDINVCASLMDAHPLAQNLCGKMSLLQSAALMQKATCVFTNDSAPLHLASAVNVPTVALFCSTVPAFGFGPLSDKNLILETNQNLTCRPCGLHGKRACPKGHFACGQAIHLAPLIPFLQSLKPR